MGQRGLGDAYRRLVTGLGPCDGMGVLATCAYVAGLVATTCGSVLDM